MKLWLDDIRCAPPGWVRCMTAQEVIAWLRLSGRGDISSPITDVSLDHDLGQIEKCTKHLRNARPRLTKHNLGLKLKDMKLSFTLYLDRVGREYEVECRCSYTPASPGNPSRNPDRFDPPSDEELEDIKLTCGGKPWPFTLTADELDDLALKCREELEDMEDPCNMPGGIEPYDAWKDRQIDRQFEDD